jgi:acetoacetyl-CoA synthetase
MSKPLWTPSEERVNSSNMMRFMERVNEVRGASFTTYSELYEWSVDRIEDFWAMIFDEAAIIHSEGYDEVLAKRTMPGARWFEGAHLNFARNLLRYKDDHPAIIAHSESRSPVRLTYKELCTQVASCAAGLKALGVREGDRVAGFLPNVPETVIAMLATTSIGAVWSSTSPDFGIQGVHDRFGQIKPKVLIGAGCYRYGGKIHNSLERLRELTKLIPEIQTTIVVSCMDDAPPVELHSEMAWEDLLGNNTQELNFVDLPFDQPVYILYSSGTTGKPKCIVHGAGGVLLQHYKELVLHTDLKRDDVITYYTTCGWMMWNWLVSSLMVGATVVLYDGSPVHPKVDTLWELMEREKLTVFGTSPKYLSGCQSAGLTPGNSFDLSTLRTILSTGAPLSDENFRWVYGNVKSDIQLASISGGTDIVSCFMLGNPLLPVHSEEIQSRGLGMKVETYTDRSESVINEVGELVCTAPAPSMPVYFWDDPEFTKYRAAYFDHFPGVWRHGDFIKITPHGGVVVYGRSDATLNPGGVRIGTAEIYSPVESLDEVVDSLVIGQKWKDDLRIVLFVQLAKGLSLSDDLENTIRQTIREEATARHVPAVILQVAEIPHTINEKKVEVAVTRIVHGQEIHNREALANPDSLEQFRNLPQLTR